MLQFDEATTALLEDAYLGADFVARRRAGFDALAPSGGETILDLGCGNGLLTRDLALAVGDAGRVVGVDPSAAMLESASRACAGRENVELVEGSAMALPLGDASVDACISLQVFEYFDDIPAALAELARVIRAGGRLAIGDMHFDTLAWHSDRPERMRDMIRAYDHHLADRQVPAALPSLLRAAGFAEIRTLPVAFCDTCLRPDGLARMMILLMSNYTVAQELVDAREARAWAEEQEALAAAGRFFFSITHFITVARRRAQA